MFDIALFYQSACFTLLNNVLTKNRVTNKNDIDLFADSIDSRVKSSLFYKFSIFDVAKKSRKLDKCINAFVPSKLVWF